MQIFLNLKLLYGLIQDYEDWELAIEKALSPLPHSEINTKLKLSNHIPSLAVIWRNDGKNVFPKIHKNTLKYIKIKALLSFKAKVLF